MLQMSQVGRTATKIKTGTDGVTRITYHSTDVVSFDRNEIILNTGGYRTVTTKNRMNQASRQFNLGYSVFQRNHEWYVAYKGLTYHMPTVMYLYR